MAFGVAGRFYDLPVDQQVASMAVAKTLRTETGARDSILPLTFAGLATLWNDTRPKKKEAATPPFPGGR